MYKIKRQPINNASSNEGIKRLRTTNDKGKNSINCIENLSNELFFEIFDYLEGCSLYQAFSNLNTRLQSLLTSSSLRLKISFISNSQSVLEHHSKFIVIPNKHRIISFRFNNTNDPSPICSRFPVDSTFSRLESLTLTGIQSNKLVLFLVGFIHLPRLFSLIIRLDQDLDDLSIIYQIIFNLPKLKYNKLSSDVSKTNLSSLINIHAQYSPIECLIIDHSCTLNDLAIILSHTPQLSRLSCKKLSTSNLTIGPIRSMTLFNLTHISILHSDLLFDEFEMFIKKIASQLQMLKFITMRDPAYLNADRWEQLILQHIPQLRTFIFKYLQPIDEHLKVTPYHERINRFTSSFWIKKQWLFSLNLTASNQPNDVLIYNIYPRRKRFRAFHDYKINNQCFTKVTDQNSIQSRHQRSSATSIVDSILHILRAPAMNNNTSFFDIIRPILVPASINRINIDRNEICIGSLIEFIRLLPNLVTLVVKSLSMTQPRCLSIEEATSFRLVSHSNRITQVVLQQMTELAEVQFLIDLCPRMKHLVVFGCDNVDPESFLRFIFMKNVKNIPSLNWLCFPLRKASEGIIEKLQKMMDVEKLCRNYTMKQRGNLIYLIWKKQ